MERHVWNYIYVEQVMSKLLYFTCTDINCHAHFLSPSTHIQQPRVVQAGVIEQNTASASKTSFCVYVKPHSRRPSSCLGAETKTGPGPPVIGHFPTVITPPRGCFFLGGGDLNDSFRDRQEVLC